MLSFARTSDTIAATTKKLEKIGLVATYLRSIPLDQAAIAAVFLSGRPFPAYEETTLQVGGSLLWRTIGELSGQSETELTEIYRRFGDAGSVAEAALAKEAIQDKAVPDVSPSSLSLSDVQHAFRELAAARGPAAKAALLRQLLVRATPLEAKYIVKIISGDLRIGLKESLVEEAIARAFDAPLADVKRANMLLGDLGETLSLAANGKLADARLRIFHPMDFMLASPVESAEEALSYFANASIEDKYDGIRAQAHVSGGEARIFSRTRDEITESFPELPPALAGFPKDVILDGEIVAWNAADARALPFSALQQRLGRKKVSSKLMHEVPVAYFVFDILYANRELLLDRPLRERAQVLSDLFAAPRTAVIPRLAAQSTLAFEDSRPESLEDSFARVLRAPAATANSTEHLEALFTAARDRGNEGLMIKDLDSLYTPGRRGKSWLKMKRELATLDVVVTAVEYGHGKRIGVLSDYTFAVWDGERLVNIGKAYSGLTDAEIAEMTKWFLAHKIRDHGLSLEVEPKIVLEVAFNNMMRSPRHESGYALRFPRIVRLRPDKRPEDADTIETVREIFNKQ
ncbi:MAG TPA: ATP-dependent DNA ligase [Terriglobales bacterium]|nr:ATP-dependent DNA ligase [Terriglobales bacterium]